MPKIFDEARVVTDMAVAQAMATQPRRFSVWFGAGVSTEAGVKTAWEICTEIRESLMEQEMPTVADVWARESLDWDSEDRRYSTCLKRYRSTPAERVDYFRTLLRNTKPSFAHHGLAILAANGVISPMLFTTNFDKLLEMAFATQGNSEYLAIRSMDEAQYWLPDEEKYYVLKLHGDYDTNNIVNTTEETQEVPEALRDLACRTLQNAGLVVLGSAGHEGSVQRLLYDILGQEDGGTPRFGLYWGVYVPGARPQFVDDTVAQHAVRTAMTQGTVNQRLVERIVERDGKKRLCRFFPVWGAAQFLRSVVQASKRSDVINTTTRYFDHAMRVHHRLRIGGLSEGAIQVRLDDLRRNSKRSSSPQAGVNVPSIVIDAESATLQLHVELAYGDMTSPVLLGAPKYEKRRRAIVSPDDIFLSAGAGVARAILEQAGPQIVLQELAKFDTVPHRAVLATSGGNLAVHYILHAAAVFVKADGTYALSEEDVQQTFEAVLRLSTALGVECIFAPLIGSGSGGIDSTHSLVAILRALRKDRESNDVQPLRLVIVVRDEGMLARAEFRQVLQAQLPDVTIVLP